MPRTAKRLDERYGRLTVVGSQMVGRHRYAKVKCDCGNTNLVYVGSLRSGCTKSCGCLSRESTSARSLRHGEAAGGKTSPLYMAWINMVRRCENPNHKSYSDYGGRGIAVCDAWHDPEVFFSWAKENGYRQGLQIDRINNDGNYCPENCRFVTSRDNNNNRRSNVSLTLNGETKTVTEWAREMGIKNCTIFARLKRGWSGEKAITTPVGEAAK